MRQAVRDRVEAFLDDLRCDFAYSNVSAVAVVGSAARGEEVWYDGRLLSDIDVMVITQSESLRVARAVENVIARHKETGIDGGRIPLRPLRRYRTLSFFEAKSNGCVVDGDSDVLSAIAVDSVADIPPWEGVRLVANRLFEHLRLLAGQSSPEFCVAKTYGALCEAQLLLEGRYKPSFRERREEVMRCPTAGVVRNLDDKFAKSMQFRAGQNVDLPDSPERALEDLLIMLEHLLTMYTKRPGNIRQQLAHLQASERHFRHRLYWLYLMLREKRMRFRHLACDPILLLWEDAIEMLETEQNRDRVRRLIWDWQRCPQILREMGER